MRNPVKMLTTATSAHGLQLYRPVAIAFMAAFILSLPSDGARAGSGVSQSGTITTGEAAEKLLQPTDGVTPDLSKNGVETGQAPAPTTESKPLQAEPIKLGNPPLGVKGVVIVGNCGTSAIRVRSYNPADIVYAVPYHNIRIEPQQWGGVSCAANRCKVQIGSGKPTRNPIAGNRVVKSGQLATGSC